MSKLAAALAWAARGFRVFPCFPDEPGKAGNDKHAKRPVWEGWTEWATRDADKIRAWWEGCEYNIGVLTDDLLVVDIDTKPGKDGMASWMALHGAFDTCTVRTPSGGFHAYYTGANVAINQGALGSGLDVRSYHGYVLAPGSTINGVPYSVEIDAPLAPAPAHIVARCRPPGQRVEHADVALVDLDTPAAVRLAVQRVETTEGAMRGEQSERAYKLACALRDYGISEAMCGALMDVWAARCSPPIAADDLRGRIANAYHYAQNAPGARHPEIEFGVVAIPAPPEATPVVATGFGNALSLGALEPRPHVLRGLLLQREVTALLAPGGVGKSLITLVIAAHLAVHKDCFGYVNMLPGAAKSIVYDAEDNLQEMSMRLHAICTALGFEFDVVRSRIMLLSGKTHGRIRLVNGGQVPSLNADAVRALLTAAADPEVALVALNPLNKLHSCNPNDNIQMGFVMDVLEEIAERSNTAVFLAHHTSKPSAGIKRAGNAHVAQGAEAVVNGTRISLTLFPPDDDDAARFGLTPTERRLFLRLDDAKLNRSLSAEEATWLRKVPVRLWTGEEVGALDAADMHTRTEHLRQMIARAVAAAMIGAGSARMKLAEAATAVKAGEPLLEKLPATVLRQRIQANLAEPVVTDGGSRVQCVEQGGSWFVVLE